MTEQLALPQATIDALLVRAAYEIQVLSALTPVDMHAERTRLVDAVRHRRPARPRWSYAPIAHDDLLRALEVAARELEGNGDAGEGPLYSARLRELSVEARLCAAAGTAGVARLA